MDDNFKLDLENWRVKAKQYNRGRMKIIINLGKEEASAYLQLKNSVFPEDLKEEEERDFLKQILFMGFETFHRNLINRTRKMLEDNPEKAKELGINPSDFQIQETKEIEGLGDIVVTKASDSDVAE